MAQQYSDLSALASHTQSFQDVLPTELASEVVFHFAQEDLRSYSLCSRVSRALSVRYLWRRVKITLTPRDRNRLADFVEFILAHSSYAATINAFCIEISSSGRPILLPDGQHAGPDGEDWDRFQEMLALLKNLTRLHLAPSLYNPSLDHDWLSPPPFSKEFYSALAQAPFAARVTHLSFYGPTDTAVDLLHVFDNVSSIDIPYLSSFYELPHRTLSRLRRACASPKLLSTLEDRGYLEHLEEGGRLSSLTSVSVLEFGDLLQSYRSLRKLYVRIFMVGNHPLGDGFNPLTFLSHPLLQELEIRFFISPMMTKTELTSSVISYLIPPNALSTFPSLTFIHITLDHNFNHRVFSYVGSERIQGSRYQIALAPNLIEHIKAALHTALVSGQHSQVLSEVRISLCETHEDGKLLALQFTARKFGESKWEVTISYGERTRDHETLLICW
ncbi:hypothetical protein DL93DRAFT_2080540 [Clavulina sp. PMI_390]|nr:hypothetical protein DL93DRAFT_2080540 [Clavulina sp. PMI_390]